MVFVLATRNIQKVKCISQPVEKKIFYNWNGDTNNTPNYQYDNII